MAIDTSLSNKRDSLISTDKPTDGHILSKRYGGGGASKTYQMIFAIFFALQMFLFSTFYESVTNGSTDRRADRPTKGQNPPIEMRGPILKELVLSYRKFKRILTIFERVKQGTNALANITIT